MFVEISLQNTDKSVSDKIKDLYAVHVTDDALIFNIPEVDLYEDYFLDESAMRHFHFYDFNNVYSDPFYLDPQTNIMLVYPVSRIDECTLQICNQKIKKILQENNFLFLWPKNDKEIDAFFIENSVVHNLKNSNKLDFEDFCEKFFIDKNFEFSEIFEEFWVSIQSCWMEIKEVDTFERMSCFFAKDFDAFWNYEKPKEMTLKIRETYISREEIYDHIEYPIDFMPIIDRSIIKYDPAAFIF